MSNFILCHRYCRQLATDLDRLESANGIQRRWSQDMPEFWEGLRHLAAHRESVLQQEITALVQEYIFSKNLQVQLGARRKDHKKMRLARARLVTKIRDKVERLVLWRQQDGTLGEFGRYGSL